MFPIDIFRGKEKKNPPIRWRMDLIRKPQPLLSLHFQLIPASLSLFFYFDALLIAMGDSSRRL